MPFGLFKKSKKDKKEKKDKKKDKADNKAEVTPPKDGDNKPEVVEPEPETEAKEAVFKEGTTLAAMASTVPRPEPVANWEDEEAPDGGFDPSNSVVHSNGTQPAVQVLVTSCMWTSYSD